MKLLLDTHIFLWYISADPRLPATSRAAIQDPGNDCYLSVASVWEAVIKASLGKLPLPLPAEEYLPRQRERHGIASLAIEEADVAQLARLPWRHRDPFDRLIVSQAIRHDLVILSEDHILKDYPASFFRGN